MKENIELLQKGLMTCECIAAFAGIFCWTRTADLKTKSFIVYLIFIALSEQLAWYLKHHGYKTETSSLFTYLIIPSEFIFAYWFISQSSASKLLKKLSILFTGLGLFASIIELIFFAHERFFFSSIAYLTYAFFLVILVLIFLFKFSKTDEIVTWWKEISFWVASGFLIYYLTTFPLYAFYNMLYNQNKNLFYGYWSIQMLLNMIMYLLFTTGLIWTSRRFK